ncbi:MAG: acyl-CoA dehydrogenase family protein [Deltaproteobacteria bacterium]|nr:acyl-CoA dehydrogenase family protein [Deltaproteobacteria bacterium]MBW2362349.1 acyl-CoA dehydrogenase family protein [Deltaproteobacteria bacterium]
MDLSYGKEYDEFRAQVRSFLEENWPPQGGASRDDGGRQFRQAAIERGYLYRNIPKRYGGSEQEADSIAAQIIREEFGAKHAPMEIRAIGMMMLVPTLLERAEEWQKEKFVRPTVMGEITWCQGYSEPGSGSDLASLQTRGVLEGDEWVINGQKIWTTSAMEADWMFCLVRTEPDVPKHAGISYLLIPMKQPGIEVRPLKQMNGTAEFNEVFFTDARTPADHIVGQRGEGWLVSRTTLKHERNSIAAAAQAAATFQGLVQFARDTKRGGRPVIEDPLVREQLAILEGYVCAHEYSGLRQFTKDAKGESPGIISMMNKLHSTNIGSMVAKASLEIMGEDGLMDPVQTGLAKLGVIPSGSQAWLNQYMYSLGIAVAGGTANIQRNVIGERGLGLPRDHYANRSSGK